MHTGMDKSATKGFALAITAAVLWGVSGTLGQFLFQQRNVSVEWLITIRMSVSGFLLLTLASIRDIDSVLAVWRNKQDAMQLMIFSIAGMLAVQYTYFAAIKHSNAATATVLQYAGPILIAVYLAIRHRRLPKPLELVAIALAVTGTFLLVTHGDIRTLAVSQPALLFGLASAVALAVYTVQSAGLLARYRSLVVVGWGMLCGGMACWLVRPPWEVTGQWDVYTYVYTILIVVFGTLIPFSLYLTAVKLIGGQKTSLLASAEPLSATLLAVYWLGVPFLALDWIGSLCIISTIFLLGIAGTPRSNRRVQRHRKSN